MREYSRPSACSVERVIGRQQDCVKLRGERGEGRTKDWIVCCFQRESPTWRTKSRVSGTTMCLPSLAQKMCAGALALAEGRGCSFSASNLGCSSVARYTHT